MSATTTTNQNTTVKILVASDVAGRHDSLFEAAEKATKGKAGPFSMLLCVGKFFGDGEDSDVEILNYINGTKTIPIPTYFIHGNETISRNINLLKGIEDDGGDLCTNLTYLGGVGKRRIDGLDVCYLSGTFDKRIYSTPPTPMSVTKGRYNEEMVKKRTHTYFSSIYIYLILLSIFISSSPFFKIIIFTNKYIYLYICHFLSYRLKNY